MIALDKSYGYEQIYNCLYELGERYGSFTEFRLLGMSHDGRKIPMLQIGKGEEVLFCTAGIHGRERVNPVLLMKMSEEYCKAYERNWKIQDFYEVRALLDNVALCMIPLVNPDGYEIAGKGYGVIQNPIYRQMLRMKQLPYETWKGNARGVDINRNFPCSSYRRKWMMEEPASENETRALIRIMQEKESVGYLDFHSRGKVIYYYRHAMSPLYNQRSYCMARHLQRLSRYRLARKDEEMLHQEDGGNSVQYYAEVRRTPAITVETLAEEAAFPLDPAFQKEAFEEIHVLPLEYLFSLIGDDY
ncbi:MAG: M14 family zinc carboxypeptidase [Eubacteriales bacterium]|nr:M14 family zinc carboxypeptidase [Eubacteriales bacterium]